MIAAGLPYTIFAHCCSLSEQPTDADLQLVLGYCKLLLCLQPLHWRQLCESSPALIPRLSITLIAHIAVLPMDLPLVVRPLIFKALESCPNLCDSLIELNLGSHIFSIASKLLEEQHYSVAHRLLILITAFTSAPQANRLIDHFLDCQIWNVLKTLLCEPASNHLSACNTPCNSDTDLCVHSCLRAFASFCFVCCSNGNDEPRPTTPLSQPELPKVARIFHCVDHTMLQFSLAAPISSSSSLPSRRLHLNGLQLFVTLCTELLKSSPSVFSSAIHHLVQLLELQPDQLTLDLSTFVAALPSADHTTRVQLLRLLLTCARLPSSVSLTGTPSPSSPNSATTSFLQHELQLIAQFLPTADTELQCLTLVCLSLLPTNRIDCDILINNLVLILHALVQRLCRFQNATADPSDALVSTSAVSLPAMISVPNSSISSRNSITSLTTPPRPSLLRIPSSNTRLLESPRHSFSALRFDGGSPLRFSQAVPVPISLESENSNPTSRRGSTSVNGTISFPQPDLLPSSVSFDSLPRSPSVSSAGSDHTIATIAEDDESEDSPQATTSILAVYHVLFCLLQLVNNPRHCQVLLNHDLFASSCVDLLRWHCTTTQCAELLIALFTSVSHQSPSPSSPVFTGVQTLLCGIAELCSPFEHSVDSSVVIAIRAVHLLRVACAALQHFPTCTVQSLADRCGSFDSFLSRCSSCINLNRCKSEIQKDLIDDSADFLLFTIGVSLCQQLWSVSLRISHSFTCSLIFRHCLFLSP